MDREFTFNGKMSWHKNLEYIDIFLICHNPQHGSTTERKNARVSFGASQAFPLIFVEYVAYVTLVLFQMFQNHGCICNSAVSFSSEPVGEPERISEQKWFFIIMSSTGFNEVLINYSCLMHLFSSDSVLHVYFVQVSRKLLRTLLGPRLPETNHVFLPRVTGPALSL